MVGTPHWAILPWARYCRIDPLGLNQNARWTYLLLVTGLTGQLRKGQFSSHWSTDWCTLNTHRSYRDPVIRVPVRPVPGPSHTCDISLFRRELPIFCPFLRKSPYENFIISLYILYISLFGNPDLPTKMQKFPSLFNHSPYFEKEISLFVSPSVSHVGTQYRVHRVRPGATGHTGSTGHTGYTTHTGRFFLGHAIVE